ncbi:MAG TPA: sensor histidine kinase [Gemmata sp.]|jgi:signal transduction histidine kinase|nr:sensor histidine kinase [Gemmata sp.]
MRLAEFILRDMEAILREWEAFAATQLPAAARMTPLALRDHAKQILAAVAKDVSTHQTKQAQADKSKGKAQEFLGAPETAAETHAILRARSGFDINQLAAEYRALRASVLRLWMDACSPDDRNLEDVVRFSEAIDQAIAESIFFFTARVDRARNLLLGMLGHDMRSPLNTILTTASYLVALNAGDTVSGAASRLIRGGTALKALLDDLVDFNRIMLGLGINVALADIDLVAVFADELEQLRGAHPRRQIKLATAGDTQGRWDGPRLQQLLRNLVVNALKYGAPDAPVRVVLTGAKADVRIEVANSGPTMERSILDQLFDPLKRGPAARESGNTDEGLGLGLFIVREVARAHGGEVDVRSDAGETVFAVRLPRRNSGSSS